mgnify:CR=1 FL=1
MLDDYRCFLMPATFEQDTYMTGYKIIPGDKRSVHHVILFLIGPDMVGAAEAKDRAEAGPGWKCFGGPGLSSDPRNIGGILGFWVRGGGATLLPEGTGRLLRAGSRVAMQVHYNTASGANPDATQMALYLAPQGVQLKRLVGMTLAAPVEILCPPGMAGEQCTREYARAKTELGFIADWIHLLCNTSIEGYAQRNVGDGSRQATSCDWTAQSAMEVYGVTAHMHLRGWSSRWRSTPARQVPGHSSTSPSGTSSGRVSTGTRPPCGCTRAIGCGSPASMTTNRPSPARVGSPCRPVT